MRPIHLSLRSLVILCVLCAPFLSPADELKVNIPPYKEFTLDNGLRVVLMEYRRLPLIEMQMIIGGGRSIEPDSMTGLASMTAELLKLGTTTRTATQIAEQVDFIGAMLNVGAGLDQFSISSEFLKKDLDTGFALFADVLLNPTFPQEEIDRDRSQREAELTSYLEDPRSIAGVCYAKRLYGTHPYGRQAIGTRAGLTRITRDAVKAFYNSAFVPNNAILVAVGDFSADELLQRIKSALGSWKSGVVPAIPTVSPATHAGRHVVMVNKPDVTQTQIRIGNIGVDIKNPDRPAIAIANSILGGGFTSRLMNEIRVKRSLTYGAGSNFASARLAGSYTISTFTKNTSVRVTIDVALEEVKKLRDAGISAWELGKAKNYLTGDFARDLQAPENLAAQIGMMKFYGLSENYLQDYVPNLRKVTLDDVRRAVKKHFHYDDLLILVVTNPAETKEQMAGLGTIEEVPAAQAIE